MTENMNIWKDVGIYSDAPIVIEIIGDLSNINYIDGRPEIDNHRYRIFKAVKIFCLFI